MKLNKSYIFSIFAGLILILSGCTRNNGDIGNWFGKWQIMSIAVDGTPEANYQPQYFMEFQNNIVKLTWLAPNGYEHETYTAYGTWQQPADNYMEFDFTHGDDIHGTNYYTPFEALHLPSGQTFKMSISNASGNNCTMTYFDESSSKQYTYELRKR
jgi:hypothetical protein